MDKGKVKLKNRKRSTSFPVRAFICPTASHRERARFKGEEVSVDLVGKNIVAVSAESCWATHMRKRHEELAPRRAAEQAPGPEATAPTDPTIQLIQEEECEFQRQDFQSRLRVSIPGHTQDRSSNKIYVGGTKVVLGDALFLLFLRLVVELFKGDDGFLYKGHRTQGGGLVEEGYLSVHGIEQKIGRLRGPFEPALGSTIDVKKFIEVSGSNVRLSTHPRYVSYDRAKLLLHHDHRVRKLADQLADEDVP